jgi:hypothetical protein
VRPVGAIAAWRRLSHCISPWQTSQLP